MTTSEHDPIARAIAALTEAARGTKIRGAGTPHEAIEQADFADIAAHVLTSVAANIGGVEAVLAGRPGSWEAGLVHDLIRGTAGDDSELLRWRTEPVRVYIDPELELADFGLDELYEEAGDELTRRAEHAQDALFEALATSEERARMEEIHAGTRDFFKIEDAGEQERATALVLEAGTITEAITQRAAAAHDSLLTEQVRALRASEAVEKLWEQDQAAYQAAYLEAVRAQLLQRGIDVEVEAIGSQGDPDSGFPLSDELHEHARRTAPLPMTGQAPDFDAGTPADAVRRAGLTYLERALASVAPH